MKEKIILEMVNVKATSKKGNTQEFDIDHARNLFKYEKARGFNEWKLPENSTYTLSANGDLIKRPGPQIDKGAEKPSGDIASEGQEDQA